MGFWNASLWLPRDVEWHQLPPQFYDLIWPIYLAFPIVLVRIALESCIGVPIGYLMGCFGYDRSMFSIMYNYAMGGFAQNTKCKRVLETFWRFTYYLVAFSYGCYVLWNKSWLWDVRQCWIGYPFHPVDNAIWWYYMVEAGFYYSLLLTAIFDTKRSDYWQLIFHHFVTVGLLSISWTINFVRVGTLVLISHDLADWVLELGKLSRYNHNRSSITNLLFVLFLISWILTRLGYFPFVVIYSGLTEAASLIQPDYELLDFTMVPYAPRLIIFLLAALLILHIIWTYLIVKVVIRTVTQGEAGDVRSDTESEDDEKSSERKKILKKKRKEKQENESDDDDQNEKMTLRKRKARRE